MPDMVAEQVHAVLQPGPMVALAVVTGPTGVLAGRRRDGVPPWEFPGGKVEPGESPEQAAARECLEETGLEVRVDHEIGRRNHPVTGHPVVYLACTLVTAAAVRTARSEELVELRWLDRDQVEDLMPGGKEFFGDGGADESGRAGEEYTHNVG